MKKRIIYYDILKVISLFAVIFMHIIGNTINTFGLNGFAKSIYDIICYLCYFAVPIFVMVSGGLFLNPNKDINIKNILKKYVLRIFICLFIFGMFYSVLEIYFNTKSIGLFLVYDSIKNIITGELWDHMWYLYLILGLYLLTPIFRVISKNCTKKEYNYLLILLFIFTIVINDLCILFDIDIAFNILIFNPYIFLYFLGDYLSRFEISNKVCNINFVFSIISVLIIIICNIYDGFNIGYMSYTCLLSFSITFSIFILVKNSKKVINDKLKNIIVNISECTLGIYLIHQFIINIIYKLLKIDIILEYPFVCLILYSIVVFVLSYIITILLRKVKFIKKYIL